MGATSRLSVVYARGPNADSVSKKMIYIYILYTSVRLRFMSIHAAWDKL